MKKAYDTVTINMMTAKERLIRTPVLKARVIEEMGTVEQQEKTLWLDRGCRRVSG